MKEKLLHIFKTRFFVFGMCMALLSGLLLASGAEARAYDEEEDEIGNSIPVEITDIEAKADPGSLADDGFIVGGTYHVNVTLKNTGKQTISLTGYRLEAEGVSINLEGKLSPGESRSYTINELQVGKFWEDEYTCYVSVKNPPDYDEESTSSEVTFLVSSQGKPVELKTESFIADNMYVNRAYPFSIKVTNKSSSQTAKNIYVVMNSYDDDSSERQEIGNTKTINPVNGVTPTGKGWMISELKPKASVTIEGTVTFLRAGIYDGGTEIVCRAEEGVGPETDDEENWDGEHLYVAVREENGATEDVAVSSVKLDRNRLSLAVGDDDILEATVLPEFATYKSISWSSSNPSVATVDKNGVIDAISVGKAIITVVSQDGSNKKAICEVTVYAEGTGADESEIEVSKIRLSAPSKKIAAGKKVKLTAAVTPSNASNKALTWRSGNSKIATVNSSGVVTIKKNAGGKTVTINATATDGSGVKGSYKITAMKGIVKKVAVTGSKSVKAGKSVNLKAKVTASPKANKTLKWASSNKKYATVSSSGRVKTYKAGKGKKVKITAKAADGSGKKASITIKIK